MKAKKFLAIAAAVLTMTCVPLNAHADTLAERDGLKYRVSDSGEDMGLYSGWAKKGGDRYFYRNGVMKKNCWIRSKGVRKYFLQADGKPATGKVTIQGVEYEFDENGVLVPDAWGLTLTAKNVTPTGCTAVFTQSGGDIAGGLETGSYFELERYQDGQWTAVKLFPEDDPIQWTDEVWMINCSDSVEITEKWEWLYGELPAGKYRLGKEIMNFRKTADFDKKMYYAYFDIKAD